MPDTAQRSIAPAPIVGELMEIGQGRAMFKIEGQETTLAGLTPGQCRILAPMLFQRVELSFRLAPSEGQPLAEANPVWVDAEVDSQGMVTFSPDLPDAAQYSFRDDIYSLHRYCESEDELVEELSIYSRRMNIRHIDVACRGLAEVTRHD